MGDTTHAPPTSGLVSRACHRLHLYISSYFATMAAKDPEVIDILDEGDNGNDNWQDVGPINVKEAAAYKEKVDNIFKTMSLMLTDDHKGCHPHYSHCV